MTKSRFSDLFQPKKETKQTPAPARKRGQKRARTADLAAVPSIQPETQEITVTRAVGKRSKADHTQVSAYIPKDTHKRVKAALIDDGRDFSELVNDLLAEWLSSRVRE